MIGHASLPTTMLDARSWLATRTWLDRDDADVRAYVARVSDRCEFDLAARLSEWRERGVLVFERAVEPALIDAFLGDVDYLKRHHRDFQLTVEVRGVHKPIAEWTAADLDSDRVKLNCIESISRAGALLSLTRDPIVFLRHAFGAPPCVLQSLTFTRGSEQPIHIDYPYVRTQTKLAHLAASWVALEDVTPSTGPLVYYPGSHRPEVSGFFDWGGGSVVLEPDSTRTPMDFAHHLWDRMKTHGITAERFLPRKGDVLVWHGNLAHEGSKILEPGRTRRSYATHYTSLEAYPPLHMKPRALETGAFVSAHGGYVFEYPWITNPRRLPSWQAAAR